MKFKVGDIVTLKSGGPEMTVVGTPDMGIGLRNGYYRSSWFAGSKPQHADYPEDALEFPPPKAEKKK